MVPRVRRLTPRGAELGTRSRDWDSVVQLPREFAARLSTGVAWSLLATVCNQGSTFAVNVMAANVLGRETFGRYAIIQSTLAAIAAMASFGLGYTATRFLAEFRATDPARAGRILGLCSAVALATGGTVAS